MLAGKELNQEIKFKRLIFFLKQKITTQDSAVFLGLNEYICGIDRATLCTNDQMFFQLTG